MRRLALGIGCLLALVAAAFVIGPFELSSESTPGPAERGRPEAPPPVEETRETAAAGSPAISPDVTVLVEGKTRIERNARYERLVQDEGLVPDFPAFHVFPGAHLERSSRKAEENLVGYEAVWKVSQPVNEVMFWYVARMRESGWTLLEENTEPGSREQFVQAQKDGLRLHLLVELEKRDDGSTETEIIAHFPYQEISR
jgi:hypothetical protein